MQERRGPTLTLGRRCRLLVVLVLTGSALCSGPACTSRKAHPAAVATVVDSAADVSDAHDGRCTLREAITTVNTVRASGPAAGECRPGAGRATIRFAIGGRPATIRPVRALPTIERRTVIDGSTQAGSAPNRAPSPKAFDGAIAISLDGRAAGGPNVAGLEIGASGTGTTVRGMAIGGFSGPGILIGARRVVVRGSYVGTDASGLVARPNAGPGITSTGATGAGTRAQIGGLAPADRVIISGNGENAAYPISGWVIEGTYIGIGADGTTAVPNGRSDADGGAGALSIDDADDVRVGGTRPGAANVISGNRNYAIAPKVVRRLRIEGNLIGTAADGSTPRPNGTVALIVSEGHDVRITGNHVVGSPVAGILIADSADTVVGARGGGGNVIRSAGGRGILVVGATSPTTGTRIQANRIEVAGPTGAARDPGPGIVVAGRVDETTIGGVATGDANVITGAVGAGVLVAELTGPTLDGRPQRTVVLGNRFRRTEADAGLGLPGLPLEVGRARPTAGPFDFTFAAFERAGGSADAPRPSVSRAVRTRAGIRLQVDLGGDRGGQRFQVDVYGADGDAEGDLRWLGTFRSRVATDGRLVGSIMTAAPGTPDRVVVSATQRLATRAFPWAATSVLSMPVAVSPR